MTCECIDYLSRYCIPYTDGIIITSVNVNVISRQNDTEFTKSLNNTDSIQLLRPVSVLITSPVTASHTRTVLSQLPLTIRDSSRLNDTDLTRPL